MFHSFHLGFLTRLSATLNGGVLPPDYYALTGEITDPVGPHVVTRHPAGAPLPETSPGDPDPPVGARAAEQVPPRVRLTQTLPFHLFRLRPRTRHVVIRQTSDHCIVAVVEVVVPGNKSSRDAARSFAERLTIILEHQIHLLLIDLLPPGRRDPHGPHGLVTAAFGAEPPALPAGQPLTLASYEAATPPTAYVEFVGLGEPLPEMPLFLQPGWYVNVPVERPYQQAWQGLPQHVRDVLISTTAP
jgi:hypothetical protein